jgi:hypothetical protein
MKTTLALLLSVVATFAAQIPPGIPTPPFGVTNQSPALPAPWTAQQYGFYFVNGATGSDAGNNTNGTPASPRATVPSSPPAGSVIVLSNTYGSGDVTWKMQGTPSAPIFIRSFDTNRTAIKGDVYLGMTNVIIEGLHVQDIDGDTNSGYGGFIFMSLRCENVAIRNCTVSGNLGWGGLSVGQFSFTEPHGNILIVSNWIHHCGDVLATNDQDRHGIIVSGATNVWVMDNTLSYNSGDGIQINGGAVSSVSTNTHHIYVARNWMHHNKQAGGWSKQAADVVFAWNVVSHHFPGNSSPGAGLGFQYDPERVWFIGNVVSNCQYGFYIGGGSGPINGTNAYFINNVVYRTSNYAFVFAGSRNLHVINNTVTEVPGGIYCPYNFAVRAVNNILSVTNLAYDFDGQQSGEFRNNVFFRHGVGAAMSGKWNGLTYTSLATWQAASSKDLTGSTAADPLLTSTFTLNTGSPARNAGVASTDLATNVFALYQSLYGQPITVDAAGENRPSSGWDIGAFESFTESPEVVAGRTTLRGTGTYRGGVVAR